MIWPTGRMREPRYLISGESWNGQRAGGAGHSLPAEPWQRRRFLAVDCGSLVPTLMESELFGYEKGAFTGAMKSKAGLFQAANGGTITSSMRSVSYPLEMQAKLLRVLQEKEVRPVRLASRNSERRRSV